MKDQIQFDRNTHNLIARGVRAIEGVAEQLERLNDNLEGDE